MRGLYSSPPSCVRSRRLHDVIGGCVIHLFKDHMVTNRCMCPAESIEIGISSTWWLGGYFLRPRVGQLGYDSRPMLSKTRSECVRSL